jgi:hypothetical protein
MIKGKDARIRFVGFGRNIIFKLYIFKTVPVKFVQAMVGRVCNTTVVKPNSAVGVFVHAGQTGNRIVGITHKITHV